MNTNPTRRAVLRGLAATGGVGVGAYTTVEAANAATTANRNRTTVPNSARLLYTCDVTTEPDPTPDVNGRIRLRRVTGTFGPTNADCFEGNVLLYRYLFGVVTGDDHGQSEGREGIAWGPRKRLPTGVYRISTIFVCDDAPSGYCARKPFYGIVVRRAERERGSTSTTHP